MSVAEVVEFHEAWLRRHPVSRRAALKGLGLTIGASLAGPLLWTQSAAAASTALKNPRCSYGTDATTTMNLAADIVSPGSSDKLYLDYGPSTSFGATTTANVLSCTAKSDTQYYLQAGLTGLSPGTKYYYRFRDVSGSSTVNSSTCSFSTAPGSPGAFTFTAFGDESTSSNAPQMVTEINRYSPQFHLLAGDICYADTTGHGLTTDGFTPSTWDNYFAEIASSSAQTPWMFGTGNHEMEALYAGTHGYGALTKRINFPGNGASPCPTTFSFQYGNVGVISIDLNDFSYEIQANLGYSGGTQKTWIDSQLATLRATSGIDFIVVLCHHALYGTSSEHGSDGGARSALAAIFDSHKVDLVINGHAHNYERTDPISGGSPTKVAVSGSTVYPATDGTTYITAGGGGFGLDGFTTGNQAGTSTSTTPITGQISQSNGSLVAEKGVTWSRCRYQGFGALVIDVAPGTSTIKATMNIQMIGPQKTQHDSIVLST